MGLQISQIKCKNKSSGEMIILHFNFWIPGRNPTVLPFKSNLFCRTFEQYYSFLGIYQKNFETILQRFTFVTVSSEKVNETCDNKTIQEKAPTQGGVGQEEGWGMTFHSLTNAKTMVCHEETLCNKSKRFCDL